MISPTGINFCVGDFYNYLKIEYCKYTYIIMSIDFVHVPIHKNCLGFLVFIVDHGAHIVMRSLVPGQG